MRLLITRPEPDAERTAQALRAQGHDVLIASMLCFEPVHGNLPDQAFAAVVMTSANAARALQTQSFRERLASLPAFTVGRHTAKHARAVGFAEVHSADGDRNDLANMLTDRFGASDAKLVYLCAENHAGDLVERDFSFMVVPVVVYRMLKSVQLPEAIQAALSQKRIDGVMHFSKRTAQAYIDSALRSGAMQSALAPCHYCLSAQVAAPLAAHGAGGIKIAARPEEAALIELVNS
ncbi:MAG TPA: uroporphyrinogen-III synthase [Xanthobacteraceae bacterium]|jgi:uroporphyrinogen-III synthase